MFHLEDSGCSVLSCSGCLVETFVEVRMRLEMKDLKKLEDQSFLDFDTEVVIEEFHLLMMVQNSDFEEN